MSKIIVILFFLFYSSGEYANAQQPRLVLPVGHTQGILSIASTPDEKLIISTSYNDHNAKVWSTRTGRLVANLKTDEGIGFVKTSPDNKSVFIGGNNKSSVLWNMYATLPVWKLEETYMDAIFMANQNKILMYTANRVDIALISSGTISNSYKTNDSIIEVKYFEKEHQILLVTKSAIKTTFSMMNDSLKMIKSFYDSDKDCKYAFYDHHKNYVFIVYDTNGTLLKRINKQELKVAPQWKFDSLKLAPHTTSYCSATSELLLGYPDSTLTLINIETGDYFTWDKFGNGISNVEFLNGGKHFLLKTDDVEALYFNTETGAEVQQFWRWDVVNPKNVGNEIHVNKAMNRLWTVLSDNVIREYKIQSDTCILVQKYAGLTNDIKKFLFLNDTIIIGDDVGQLKKIAVAGGRIVESILAHDGPISALAFSTDREKLISAGDTTIKIWDRETLKLQAVIQTKYNVFSIDEANNIIVTTSNNVFQKFNDEADESRIELFDVASGKSIITKTIESKVFNSCFDGEGKNIIYCNNDDSSIVIANLKFETIRSIKLDAWLYEVNLSKDGKSLIVYTQNSIIFLDYEKGSIIKTTPIESSYDAFSFHVSEEKGLLIYNPIGKKLIIEDLVTNKKLGEFITHSANYIHFYFDDDKKLFTYSEDGTIKYWDFDNGILKEIFVMVPFLNSDYIIKIPAGYYQTTTNAAKQLYYVSKDLRVITFEQLDVKYNRPDKVLEAIGNTDTALINSYRKAWEKRIKKLGIDTTAFREGYSVPEADFVNREKIIYEQKTGTLSLHISGMDSTYSLDRFNVWVNESPIFGQRGISIKRNYKNRLDTTIIIKLSQGENRIETSITNINGTESYRMPLIVNYSPVVKQKETIRFIGIGIDKFSDSQYNLNYSAKDIRDLAIKLKQKYGSTIIIDTLFNNNVTISNVKALKQQLMQTSVNDKVIISYSGHGLLSKDYDYYLSTYSVNFNMPEENGLPYDELENLLDSIPARKKLMLIDACHSGEVDKEEGIAMNKMADSLGLIKGIIIDDSTTTTQQLGLQNSFELMQSLFVNVGKSTGATIISAAAGNQFALERGDLKNGVFTYSLLEAMEKNKSIKISELKKIVGERVEELTNGMQKPTSRNETIAVDWSL